MISDVDSSFFEKLEKIIYFLTGFRRQEKKVTTDFREYLIKPLSNGITFYFSRGGSNQIEDWAEAEEVHEICLVTGAIRVSYRGKYGFRWSWCADYDSKKTEEM